MCSSQQKSLHGRGAAGVRTRGTSPLCMVLAAFVEQLTGLGGSRWARRSGAPRLMADRRVINTGPSLSQQESAPCGHGLRKYEQVCLCSTDAHEYAAVQRLISAQRAPIMQGSPSSCGMCLYCSSFQKPHVQAVRHTSTSPVQAPDPS